VMAQVNRAPGADPQEPRYIINEAKALIHALTMPRQGSPRAVRVASRP
jgi:hypothetical protein